MPVSVVPATRPGRNGGKLRAGGKPGNRGGPGRTPSVVRAKLLSILNGQTGVVADIAKGKPVQTIRVPVRDLAPYVICGNCGQSQVRPKSVKDGMAEITVRGSATSKERLEAIDLAARYSIGAVKGVSEESVRQRLGQTLDAIQELVQPEYPELFAQIVQTIKPFWTK